MLNQKSVIQRTASIQNNQTEKKSLKYFLTNYGITIAFVILCIVLTIASPAFMTVSNILNILRQVSIIGIISVGMTFVIINGGIDLSVGSVLALSAVVATSFAHPESYPLIVPIILGMLVGTACGAVNGFVIAKWNIAPFIVTLGMMTVARGVTLVYTDGRPVINLSESYTSLGGGHILGIPIPIIFFIAVVLIGIFILKFTKFGRYVFASGGNEQATKVSGINVKWVKIGVYSIVGLASGLAGILLSSRVMTGSPVLGTMYELDAIAAVVIGGTSLAGGIGSVRGTVLGVLIVGVMNNGLDLLNVSSYYQQILKGIIIVLAVLLDHKKN
ncbi:ABC transporter permease [Alkalihalobacillus hwajinpoensis]|uniref:ABC transporter permease n=1 Tax=Guptibacillus hwajinpoensis TaxID=208199 RepID=UPI00188413AD|nr:ABC transporter permease [Pseudalkalibacillus hwajinpoensis]MBF0706037.1 ABC transporter permease [Pseudalkalibacillus hwajinpoensis]